MHIVQAYRGASCPPGRDCARFLARCGLPGRTWAAVKRHGAKVACNLHVAVHSPTRGGGNALTARVKPFVRLRPLRARLEMRCIAARGCSGDPARQLAGSWWQCGARSSSPLTPHCRVPHRHHRATAPAASTPLHPPPPSPFPLDVRSRGCTCPYRRPRNPPRFISCAHVSLGSGAATVSEWAAFSRACLTAWPPRRRAASSWWAWTPPARLPSCTS